jgi:regulator of replication initiation timing
MNDTVFALQDIVKMAKYRKRCFDQIEPTFKENQGLTAELERLRRKLETTEKKKAELEAIQHNAVIQLGQKERERTGKLSSHYSPSTKKGVNRYSCADQPICRLGK